MNLQTGEVLTLGQSSYLRSRGWWVLKSLPVVVILVPTIYSSVFFMYCESFLFKVWSDTKEDSSEDHVLWPVKQLWARSGHQTEFLLAPSLKMMDERAAPEHHKVTSANVRRIHRYKDLMGIR